ncbi:hypothetical protein QNI19_13315 [Cytophagaceae bacterium DM2B3-1]|uniref:Lipopolysaccharide biosynthesis protein n=1 Tax=Xanthocytophaga flava TaxID=3048013 RepID=A0ABT7CJK4_9BACT|nr:hypothetical protein [Xanthocytophaga flavus]MDJ1493916.1 hypothetical protein [Xanthocytophaga flavus]
MSLIDLIRLLVRNWLMLTVIPMILAVTIFYLTRNETKIYSSDTTVYTGIASGYTLQGNAQADFFATSNAFDNLLNLINSRQTREEVAVRLIASHLMLKEHDPDLLSWKSYSKLHELISDSLARTIVADTKEKTISNIYNLLRRDAQNAVYLLINGDKPNYSISALSKMTAMRLNSSDLVKIQYESEDAAMCKNSLEILTEVFIRKKRELREGQTESVIKYFEEEVAKAQAKLGEAEQKFLAFNKNNNIINYYEQTKYISAEKEDLYDKYNGLEMDYAGSFSVMGMIEQKLQNRTGVSLNAQEIMSYRSQLSKISTELAKMELYSKDTNDQRAQTQMEDLRKQADNVSQQIKASVDNLFKNTHTIQGLPSKDLLDDWVKNAIIAEETKSRLSVMDKRKQEFQQVYEQMAPLGATLKRIEREIDIAEKEYLSLLHGLNLSRLMQQSNELASNLKVMDAPYFPLKSKGSKRMVLVIAGGFGGFVIIAACLIAMEMADKNLKKLSLAAKRIGLPMFGIYPLLMKGSTWNKFLTRVEELLVQQLLLKKGQANTRSVYTVAIISTQNGEGKTTIARSLAYKLNQMQQPSLVVLPNNHRENLTDTVETDCFYNIFSNLSTAQSWAEMTEGKVKDGFLLLEIPALLENTYPVALLKEVDLILLVVRANRNWRQADKLVIEQLQQLTTTPIEIIVNGVNPEHTEEWIGEVPKTRSKLRRWTKRMMKMEFKKKIGFAVRKKD